MSDLLFYGVLMEVEMSSSPQFSFHLVIVIFSASCVLGFRAAVPTPGILSSVL